MLAVLADKAYESLPVESPFILYMCYYMADGQYSQRRLIASAAQERTNGCGSLSNNIRASNAEKEGKQDS